MQYLTLLAGLLASASAALGSPIAQQAPNTPVATPTPGAGNTTTTSFCGAHRYTPNAYVCHNNAVLCPIQNGYPLQACGQSCYDARIYSCSSAGTLQLGSATNATVAGVWPPAGVTPTGTPVAIKW